MPADPHTAPAPPSAEGPAFPPLIKLLLTLFTLSVFVAGAIAADQPMLRHAAWEVKGLIVAGLAMLLVFNYWVFKSRIRVDSASIHQTWIWNKHVNWSDVTQAKMIYVPFFAWIIAPRLVVRTRGGLATLFHAADAQVLQAFTQYAMAPHMRTVAS